MKVKAKLNNLRISPRKVRLVIDLIRGLDIVGAKTQLNFLVKKSARPISKLLDSAVANAKNNFGLDESNLYISEIFAGEGPVLKRIMPRAMGRAFPIMKRTSHITIVLEEKIDSKEEKGEDALNKKDTKKTVKKAEEETEKKSIKKTVKKVAENKIKDSEKPKANKPAAKS